MLIAHEYYSNGTLISVTLIRYAYERGCLMCELCLASKVKKSCSTIYQTYYLSPFLLMQLYLIPNNIFLYRGTGANKVQQVWRHHRH